MIHNKADYTAVTRKKSAVIKTIIKYSLMFVVALLLIYHENAGNTAGMYDEGLIAYGGSLVARGYLPYKDFHTIYAPAQFYAAAAAFKAGGESLETLRFWDSILRACVLIILFVIVSGLSGNAAAYLTFFAGLMWMCVWESYGYPSIPAIFFSLLSVESLRRYFSGRKNISAVLAGVFCGFVFLFRQDFGFYVLTAEIAALCALVCADRTDKKDFRPLLLPALGAAAVLLLPVTYFMLNVPLNTLLYDLFIYPVIYAPAYRDLPYPALDFSNIHIFLNTMPFYFPFFIIVSALCAVYYGVRQKPDKQGIIDLIFGGFLILLTVIFFNQARIRSDGQHLQPFLIISFVLQAYVYSAIKKAGKTAKIACVSILVILNVLTVSIPAYHTYNVLSSGRAGAGRGIPMSEGFYKAIQYIRNNTKPGEYIFSGNQRHDSLTHNNVLMYFFAKRDCPFKYSAFDPGIVTSAPIQQKMIEGLKNKKVKLVILYDAGFSLREPNKSTLSSGVMLLDNYIRDNYAPAGNFNEYQAWKLKGPSAR